MSDVVSSHHSMCLLGALWGEEIPVHPPSLGTRALGISARVMALVREQTSPVPRFLGRLLKLTERNQAQKNKY